MAGGPQVTAMSTLQAAQHCVPSLISCPCDRIVFLFLYFTFSIFFFFIPDSPLRNPVPFSSLSLTMFGGKSSSASEHVLVRTVSALGIQPL